MLDDFVQAAGRKDYDAMFDLLSLRTRSRYGADAGGIRAQGAGNELAIVLGAMARRAGATSP